MLMRQLADYDAVASIPGDGGALKERAAALDRHADALRALVTGGDGFSAKG
jgi:hypothetical protein